PREERHEAAALANQTRRRAGPEIAQGELVGKRYGASRQDEKIADRPFFLLAHGAFRQRVEVLLDPFKYLLLLLLGNCHVELLGRGDRHSHCSAWPNVTQRKSPHCPTDGESAGKDNRKPFSPQTAA